MSNKSNLISVSRNLTRPRKPWVCPDCRQRRYLSTSWLQKKAEAKEQWDNWAREIRDGKRQDMLSILDDRGFVNAIAGERNALKNLLIDKRIGAYCGIDPTARSLHLGHLVPLMALFWMHVHGFHTVSLIGAGTARIGDPTGRTSDRNETTSTERKANIVSIHYQLKKIWTNLEKVAKKHGYVWEKYWHRELVNNAAWWNKTPLLDVLKYMGNGIRMGSLLGRDTVQTKMASETGMSFAEFCYPVMQAWDWWYMYDTKGIQMQIGGSDQYGNIVTGIEAIKHVAKTHPHQDQRQEGGVKPHSTPCGFTVPLLTSPSGEKFGKSAGNAIWLDDSMTNLFNLYGYFVRVADQNVERYLKLFTFLSLPKIQSVMTQHKSDPSKRIAQHTLARELVELVHGEEAARNAADQHEKFFAKGKTLADLAAQQDVPSVSRPAPTAAATNPYLEHQYVGKRIQGSYISPAVNKYAPQVSANNAPTAHITLPKSLIYNQPIAKVLYAAGLVSSRSEGHRLASQKGAYIGSRPNGEMTDSMSFIHAKIADVALTWNNVIRDENSGKDGEEGLLILRSGKWNVRVVRIVSDEKFVQLGLPSPPAWEEWLSQQAAERAENASSKDKQDAKSAAEWERLTEEDSQEDAELFSSTRRKREHARYASVGKGYADLKEELKPSSQNFTSSVERRKPIRRSREPGDEPFPKAVELDKLSEQRSQTYNRLNAAHVPRKHRNNPIYSAVRKEMSPEDIAYLKRRKAMLVKEEARQAREKTEKEGKERLREMVRQRRRVKDLTPEEIKELT